MISGSAHATPRSVKLAPIRKEIGRPLLRAHEGTKQADDVTAQVVRLSVRYIPNESQQSLPVWLFYRTVIYVFFDVTTLVYFFLAIDT